MNKILHFYTKDFKILCGQKHPKHPILALGGYSYRSDNRPKCKKCEKILKAEQHDL